MNEQKVIRRPSIPKCPHAEIPGEQFDNASRVPFFDAISSQRNRIKLPALLKSFKRIIALAHIDIDTQRCIGLMVQELSRVFRNYWNVVPIQLPATPSHFFSRVIDDQRSVIPSICVTRVSHSYPPPQKKTHVVVQVNLPQKWYIQLS